MEYQLIYKDAEGHLTTTKQMREVQKNLFAKELDAKGVKYDIKMCPDTLYHCPKVVFDMQKIDAARKAVKEGKDLPGVIYTCGDEHKIAKKNMMVKVRCANGEERNAFVIVVWKATFDEVIAYKKKIGYAHLSPITGKV